MIILVMSIQNLVPKVNHTNSKQSFWKQSFTSSKSSSRLPTQTYLQYDNLHAEETDNVVGISHKKCSWTLLVLLKHKQWIEYIYNDNLHAEGMPECQTGPFTATVVGVLGAVITLWL